MKKILFAALLFSVATCNAQQTYTTISLGATPANKQPVISPSFGVEYHKAFIQGDLVVFTHEDEPAAFGLRAGYRIAFVTPSVGRYYIMFSTDKYDAYKNGWHTGYFLKFSKGNFGLEPGYLHRFLCTASYTLQLRRD